MFVSSVSATKEKLSNNSAIQNLRKQLLLFSSLCRFYVHLRRMEVTLGPVFGINAFTSIAHLLKTHGYRARLVNDHLHQVAEGMLVRP